MTAQVNILAIPHRHRGPPNSGNGGYVCGVLARHIQEPTEVTLRAPAPLETPLEAALRDDGSWELMDGPTVVAVARPAPVELSHLEEASLEEAREAEKNPVIKAKEHLLPMCFVCGPDRPAGDGLRIMAGPLRRRGRHGRVVQAASWTPSRNLSADDGLVAAEFVWAALDCPSGYAATYDPDRDGFDKSPVLLGRLAARISHRPRAGEGCVVTAWETGREGRKRFADSRMRRLRRGRPGPGCRQGDLDRR